MTYQLTIDDSIGPWGYSKQYVRNVLSNYKGKHVDVKISSLGGDLDHGLDIRQQFLDHGDVTVYLSGFVASAATVIAMGAKRIVMSKYAMFLVHKCLNFIDAWGAYNADQMQQLIEQLEANKKENDKIDVVLANMYAAKCNKKVSEILDVLKEGRWLTAQEALDFGFIDEISENLGDHKLNFTPELQSKFNAFGISTSGLKLSAAPSIPSTPKQPEMKNYKFSSVDSLLKLDVGLTPDNDGDVTIKAEQMEAVNARLESLTADVTSKDKTIADLQKEASELKEQVKNLQNGPGAETGEIEDGAAEEAFSASDIYNEIKSII